MTCIFCIQMLRQRQVASFLNSGISYLSSRSIFLTFMCLYSAVSRISLELMEVRASKTLKFVIFSWRLSSYWRFVRLKF